MSSLLFKIVRWFILIVSSITALLWTLIAIFSGAIALGVIDSNAQTFKEVDLEPAPATVILVGVVVFFSAVSIFISLLGFFAALHKHFCLCCAYTAGTALRTLVSLLFSLHHSGGLLDTFYCIFELFILIWFLTQLKKKSRQQSGSPLASAPPESKSWV